MFSYCRDIVKSNPVSLNDCFSIQDMKAFYDFSIERTRQLRIQGSREDPFRLNVIQERFELFQKWVTDYEISYPVDEIKG